VARDTFGSIGGVSIEVCKKSDGICAYGFHEYLEFVICSCGRGVAGVVSDVLSIIQVTVEHVAMSLRCVVLFGS
jgi:hypothetical protein